jgi:hypothetical protein
MDTLQTRAIGRKISKLDSYTAEHPMSRHMRRRAYALQDRRWRKLNRYIDKSPYFDTQIKHGGGIL